MLKASSIKKASSIIIVYLVCYYYIPNTAKSQYNFYGFSHALSGLAISRALL
nr:MAG TPA: hypothetical protein [Caudoviricetes sp.]